MALWTDVITPAELTGYARQSLAAFEASRGSLAQWLPNREVADIQVRFVKGASGLVDIANHRAYDAEPTIGKGPTGARITLELPAVSQTIPVSEYNQLRSRNGGVQDETIRNWILDAVDTAVRAIADATERVRGIVINTGKATITNEGGFTMDDDFGRSGSHSVSAAALWSVATTDALTDLTTWADTYRDDNGEDPGCILTSTRVLRAMAVLNQFKTQLAGGSTRPATVADVQATLAGNGLPPIFVYDRNVSVAGSKTKVLPTDKLFYLPAPVATDAWQDTDLGATFWGQTLTSTDASFNITEADQPGLVAGVWRNEKVPMIAEVQGDSINLPVLANADLSFAADVL